MAEDNTAELHITDEYSVEYMEEDPDTSDFDNVGIDTLYTIRSKRPQDLPYEQ